MIFCAEPHSATESVLISAAPPRCSISCLVCWAGVADWPSPDSEAPTSLMMTLAPAAAMARAISRPMPPPEPVTTTTLPSIMPAIVPSSAGSRLPTGEYQLQQPLDASCPIRHFPAIRTQLVRLTVYQGARGFADHAQAVEADRL